uniref:Epoxide hydrolase n=1 Tax=Ascaris lumbricoides TaxID=6252 RepID=A0A0M3HMX6_ASCLU
MGLLLQDEFFGAGNVTADDKAITEYSINITHSAIEHFMGLIDRGRSHLIPDFEGPHIQHELSSDYLKNISDIILKFNWKQHEYFLNTFPQYRTEIEGLRIHFIRAAYPQMYERIYPLLLIHSWPSTFWEFYKVIPILSNPRRFGFDFGVKTRFAFEVVVPSLPGFGFSDKPSKRGLGVIEIARILSKLMQRLGFYKYFVHGHGQLGCSTAEAVAILRADSVRGLHVGNPSMINFISPQTVLHQRLHELLTTFTTFNPSSYLSLSYESDKRHLLNDFNLIMQHGVYGVSFADSAFALIAFVLDRWALATDPDYSLNGATQLHRFLTVDELLTNIFVCWLTQTLPHGAHVLANTANHSHMQMFRASINVATSVMIGSSSPRQASASSLQRRYHNITRYVTFANNGEFLALQSPNSFAEDIYTFVEEIVG